MIPVIILILGCITYNGYAAPASQSATIYQEQRIIVPETPLDRIVFRNFERHDVHPTYCTDAVFLRRVYMDVIGTLPSEEEARAFLTNPTLNKRQELIEQLLTRDEFADYWAMKWSDLLRIKAEFPVNLWPNAAQAYHRWVRASLHENKPYDRFVRELLVCNGSNFRVGPVNFYRAMQDRSPEGLAGAVALAFMGIRFDKLPEADRVGMAVFFSQIAYKPTREWKEEIVYWDPYKNLTNNVTNSVAETETELIGRVPSKKKIKISPDQDPRAVFADWLITSRNDWFTANIVNRIWAWLMGRGIIHEPDDIRPDNPPCNPALLAYLQKELVRSDYDTRHIYRLILNSRTYQLSSIFPTSTLAKAAPLFAYYPLRQLEAEVLIDAINKITGSTDLYTSAIPEPFTFIPSNKSAISLPDGSITSSFLELFGRPARATGFMNERVSRASASQRMHLLNASHIQSKLETGAAMRALVNPQRKPREMIEAIYLTVLSRFPTTEEITAFETYMRSGVVKGTEAGIDLVWALINSEEFLFRH